MARLLSVPGVKMIQLDLHFFWIDHTHALSTGDIKSCKPLEIFYPDCLHLHEKKKKSEELSLDALAYIMTMLTTACSVKTTSPCQFALLYTLRNN